MSIDLHTLQLQVEKNNRMQNSILYSFSSSGISPLERANFLFTLQLTRAAFTAISL